MATVRILRSTTTGNTPSSLVSGQIAINEADGILFFRALNGSVTPLSASVTELYEYASVANFPPTGTSPALYVDKYRGKIFRWETSAYVEVGPGYVGVDGAITTAGGDILTTEGGEPLLF